MICYVVLSFVTVASEISLGEEMGLFIRRVPIFIFSIGWFGCEFNMICKVEAFIPETLGQEDHVCKCVVNCQNDLITMYQQSMFSSFSLFYRDWKSIP